MPLIQVVSVLVAHLDVGDPRAVGLEHLSKSVPSRLGVAVEVPVAYGPRVGVLDGYRDVGCQVVDEGRAWGASGSR